MRLWLLFAVLAVATVLPAHGAGAGDTVSASVTLKDHRFVPDEIRVPAGVRVELKVHNLDATPEEFESTDLRREKIVTGNGKITVWIGPLPKGEYGFYGEFHQETAQGKLIAE